jgi:2-haloacid dehalogenase
VGALRPILQAHDRKLDDAGLLKLYSEIEQLEQQGEFKTYRKVLANVVYRLGERLGFRPSAQEAASLADSLGDWAPFADTVSALQRLQRRFKLAVISNTDDDLFALSARHLKAPFADAITAEQARAYKPSAKIFELAFSRLKVNRERWLHVGQSVFHDVIPAKSLGLATALVLRRGWGATPQAAGEPDIKVPDLQSLAATAGV